MRLTNLCSSSLNPGKLPYRILFFGTDHFAVSPLKKLVENSRFVPIILIISQMTFCPIWKTAFVLTFALVVFTCCKTLNYPMLPFSNNNRLFHPVLDSSNCAKINVNVLGIKRTENETKKKFE